MSNSIHNTQRCNLHKWNHTQKDPLDAATARWARQLLALFCTINAQWLTPSWSSCILLTMPSSSCEQAGNRHTQPRVTIIHGEHSHIHNPLTEHKHTQSLLYNTYAGKGRNLHIHVSCIVPMVPWHSNSRGQYDVTQADGACFLLMTESCVDSNSVGCWHGHSLKREIW